MENIDWLAELERELSPQQKVTINRWLERGDGVAIYENEDLSSRGLGERKYVSFGSTKAQLEGLEPPTILPDIGGAINWRFRLVGVYRGYALR